MSFVFNTNEHRKDFELEQWYEELRGSLPSKTVSSLVFGRSDVSLGGFGAPAHREHNKKHEILSVRIIAKILACMP